MMISMLHTETYMSKMCLDEVLYMPHKATRIKTIKQPLIMNYVWVYEVLVVDTIHVTHTLIPLQLYSRTLALLCV